MRDAEHSVAFPLTCEGRGLHSGAAKEDPPGQLALLAVVGTLIAIAAGPTPNTYRCWGSC